MLIDRFLPHSDFSERHRTRVRATPEGIYEIIRHGDLGAHWLARLLMSIRGLGRTQKRFGLETFLGHGFAILAEDAPREIVIGVEGPFWKPACKLHSVSAESFQKPVPANAARAAWNFFIGPSQDGTSTVTTETRILCADDARMKFRMYWMIIRPGSGIIRRLMLRAIRKEAER